MISNRLRKEGFVLPLIILFIFIIGQMSLVSGAEPQYGGWLTVATDSTAVGLDPLITVAFATLTFAEHVYDSLMEFSPDMELVPNLAKSYEQPDELTYIFYLREGVMFHHGREMTAEDVKYSFDRVLDPSLGSPKAILYEPFLESIEIIDRYTIQFNFKQPSPDFLNIIARVSNMSIVPKELGEKHGNFQEIMVGTGPFMLESYEHGVQAVFVRNDNYFREGLPYIDGFTFRVVRDEMSRVAALRRGTLDIAWVKEIVLAEPMEADPNVNLIMSAPGRRGFFRLTHDRFPGNNVLLRQAIASSLDRQAIINFVLHGYGELTGLVPSSNPPWALTPEEIDQLPFYKQDYDLARKLLAEAGYPNGFEFTVVTSPHSPDYVPACEIIQEQLSHVGIKMNIEIVEWGVLSDIRRRADYEAVYLAGVYYSSPTEYYMDVIHGDSPGNEINITREQEPEFHRLMDLSATETNVEKRIQIFRDLQQEWAERVISIYPYTMPSRMEMVRSKVQNYYFMPDNSRRYIREAWIAD